MRWLWSTLAIVGGVAVAEIARPWLMETFAVPHPLVVVLPAALGLLLAVQVIRAAVAGIRAYRAPRITGPPAG